jgi:hypothetical protein
MKAEMEPLVTDAAQLVRDGQPKRADPPVDATAPAILDLARLARVTGGGESSTTVAVLGGSVTTSRSDAALCARRAADLAGQQYPDTRPFGLPVFTDDNAAARDRARRSNVDTMCTKPAGGGSGGFR